MKGLAGVWDNVMKFIKTMGQNIPNTWLKCAMFSPEVLVRGHVELSRLYGSLSQTQIDRILLCVISWIVKRECRHRIRSVNILYKNLYMIINV